MNFGALRVLNDDLVQPKAGFGAHPHRDAEILTYIVDGELAHKDSMGNYESLGREWPRPLRRRMRRPLALPPAFLCP